MSVMHSAAPSRVYSNAAHQFSARSNVAAVSGPGGADHDGTGFKIHHVWLVCASNGVDLSDRGWREGFF